MKHAHVPHQQTELGLGNSWKKVGEKAIRDDAPAFVPNTVPEDLTVLEKEIPKWRIYATVCKKQRVAHEALLDKQRLEFKATCEAFLGWAAMEKKTINHLKARVHKQRSYVHDLVENPKTEQSDLDLANIERAKTEIQQNDQLITEMEEDLESTSQKRKDPIDKIQEAWDADATTTKRSRVATQ